MFAVSHFHVRDASLLHEAHGHHVRRHQADAGVQSGEQVGAHLGDRQLPRLRQLLGDGVERDVALPEDRAPRLQRLDAERAVSRKTLRTAGFFVAGSMIFERSPSAYFSQSRSDALMGKARPEMPTTVRTSGNSSLYTSRNASR